MAWARAYRELNKPAWGGVINGGELAFIIYFNNG